MGGREISNDQFQFSKTFVIIADNLEESITNLKNVKEYYRKQKYYNVKEVEKFEKEVNYFRFK